MSEEEKAHENEVFDQKLDVEELDAVSGGDMWPFIYGEKDSNKQYCTQFEHRPMYGPDGNQFPHCAATVEKDSGCCRNDGCYKWTVVYVGMRTECGRAWE